MRTSVDPDGEFIHFDEVYEFLKEWSDRGEIFRIDVFDNHCQREITYCLLNKPGDKTTVDISTDGTYLFLDVNDKIPFSIDEKDRFWISPQTFSRVPFICLVVYVHGGTSQIHITIKEKEELEPDGNSHEEGGPGMDR